MRIDMAYGYVILSGNEVRIGSTVPAPGDPPKLRLESIAGGSFGGVTFAKVREDGVPEEMVLIQGKQDERVRDNPLDFSGELTVHVRHWQPGLSDDAQMVKVMEMRHDGVKIKGINL